MRALVTGGARPKGFDRGYFVEPTVFADVRNDMRIAQEEIFGPVLAVIAYDDDEDAVGRQMAAVAQNDVAHVADAQAVLVSVKSHAVALEDRHPISEVLAQTPDIPDNCQWGVFLRNHDELTLEMVTDEDRDYMYRTYARDRQARINLGIRRRLAPLLGQLVDHPLPEAEQGRRPAGLVVEEAAWR